MSDYRYERTDTPLPPVTFRRIVFDEGVSDQEWAQKTIDFIDGRASSDHSIIIDGEDVARLRRLLSEFA